MEACVVWVDIQDQVIEMGTPKMCNFLKTNQDVIQKVYLHFTNGICMTCILIQYHKGIKITCFPECT